MAQNAVLSHALEANIWKERRQTLAQVSSPSLFLPSVSSRNLKSFLAPSLSPISQEQSDPLLASLLGAEGSVRKISSGRPDAPTIIHIQDVHKNTEAQENISRLLGRLFAGKKIGLVALEAAFESLDFSTYRQFSRPNALRAVADYLLKEHRISGPIHAALSAGNDVPAIVGVDDARSYYANIEAYKEASELMDEMKTRMASLRQDLEVQKDRIFNSSLRTFDRHAENFHDGKMPLTAYVGVLAGAEPMLGSNVHLFQEASALESAMDIKKVESERAAFLERLVPALTKEETAALIARSAAYRLGKVDQKDFYSELRALAKRHQIELREFPAFDGYLRYVLLVDRIDVAGLLKEIDELENRAYDAAIKTRDERQLADESRLALLKEKLSGFALTSDEWAAYKKLNGETEEGLEPFEAFYEHAIARDAAMAENLRKGLDETRAKTAVLVTGGFHSAGIDGRLARQGYTVLSFSPRITKIDEGAGSSYLSVFTQEKAPLDKLFRNEKVYLGDIPLPDAERWVGIPVKTAMLLRALGDARPAQAIADELRLMEGSKLSVLNSRPLESDATLQTATDGQRVEMAMRMRAGGDETNPAIEEYEQTVRTKPTFTGRLLALKNQIVAAWEWFYYDSPDWVYELIIVGYLEKWEVFTSGFNESHPEEKDRLQLLENQIAIIGLTVIGFAAVFYASLFVLQWHWAPAFTLSFVVTMYGISPWSHNLIINAPRRLTGGATSAKKRPTRPAAEEKKSVKKPVKKTPVKKKAVAKPAAKPTQAKKTPSKKPAEKSKAPAKKPVKPSFPDKVSYHLSHAITGVPLGYADGGLYDHFPEDVVGRGVTAKLRGVQVDEQGRVLFLKSDKVWIHVGEFPEYAGMDAEFEIRDGVVLKINFYNPERALMGTIQAAFINDGDQVVDSFFGPLTAAKIKEHPNALITNYRLDRDGRLYLFARRTKDVPAFPEFPSGGVEVELKDGKIYMVRVVADQYDAGKDYRDMGYGRLAEDVSLFPKQKDFREKFTEALMAALAAKNVDPQTATAVVRTLLNLRGGSLRFLNRDRPLKGKPREKLKEGDVDLLLTRKETLIIANSELENLGDIKMDELAGRISAQLTEYKTNGLDDEKIEILINTHFLPWTTLLRMQRTYQLGREMTLLFNNLHHTDVERWIRDYRATEDQRGRLNREKHLKRYDAKAQPLLDRPQRDALLQRLVSLGRMVREMLAPRDLRFDFVREIRQGGAPAIKVVRSEEMRAMGVSERDVLTIPIRKGERKFRVERVEGSYFHVVETNAAQSGYLESGHFHFEPSDAPLKAQAEVLFKIIRTLQETDLDTTGFPPFDRLVGLKPLSAADDPKVDFIDPRIPFIEKQGEHSGDEAQEMAVRLALSKPENLIIWGPPATGKSNVNAEILQQLVLDGKKIFFGAPFHAATDSTIKDFVSDPRIPILRFARDRAKLHYGSEAVHLGRSADLDEATNTDKFLQRRKANPQAGGVMTGTVTGLTTDRTLRENLVSVNFMQGGLDVGMIDESSRLRILDIIGLLPYLKPSAKIILSGDEKQLQPFVPSGQDFFLGKGPQKDKVRQDDLDNYNKSAVGWLSDVYHGESVMLSTNRRQHPLIAKLVSLISYEGDVHSRGLEDWDEFTLNIYDVGAGQASRSLEVQDKGSISNHISAFKVLDFVAHFHARGVPLHEITILTPFIAQRELFKNLLKTSFPAAKTLPVVTTIDSYQGGQNRVVLLDMVRSNDKREIGNLLNDINRLNVALSRAEDNLIIFWDSRTFEGTSSADKPETREIREKFNLIARYVREEVRPYVSRRPRQDGESEPFVFNLAPSSFGYLLIQLFFVLTTGRPSDKEWVRQTGLAWAIGEGLALGWLAHAFHFQTVLVIIAAFSFLHIVVSQLLISFDRSRAPPALGLRASTALLEFFAHSLLFYFYSVLPFWAAFALHIGSDVLRLYGKFSLAFIKTAVLSVILTLSPASFVSSPVLTPAPEAVAADTTQERESDVRELAQIYVRLLIAMDRAESISAAEIVALLGSEGTSGLNRLDRNGVSFTRMNPARWNRFMQMVAQELRKEGWGERARSLSDVEKTVGTVALALEKDPLSPGNAADMDVLFPVGPASPEYIEQIRSIRGQLSADRILFVAVDARSAADYSKEFESDPGIVFVRNDDRQAVLIQNNHVDLVALDRMAVSDARLNVYGTNGRKKDLLAVLPRGKTMRGANSAEIKLLSVGWWTRFEDLVQAIGGLPPLKLDLFNRLITLSKILISA